MNGGKTGCHKAVPDSQQPSCFECGKEIQFRAESALPGTHFSVMTLDETLHGFKADRHHGSTDFSRNCPQGLTLFLHFQDFLQYALLHRIFDETAIGMNHVAERPAAAKEAALLALVLFHCLDALSGTAFFKAMEALQHVGKQR